MRGERVRVWLDRETNGQHFAVPPDSETAHEWEGDTVCGRTGHLRWVTNENVDANLTCPECVAVEGFSPSLEGDDPGPV